MQKNFQIGLNYHSTHRKKLIIAENKVRKVLEN